MKLHFSQIPSQGVIMEIDDQAWFPDHQFTKKGKALASLRLNRKEERVFVNGRITVELETECDRCLGSFAAPCDQDFSVDVELHTLAENEQAEDHHCSDSEMDVVLVNEPEIDIFALLEEQIFLLEPSKRLCSEECQGICPGCGANLNRSSCCCSKGSAKSPFHILEKLKKKPLE